MDKPIEFQRLDHLSMRGQDKIREYQRSVEEDERNGLQRPSDTTRRLLEEVQAQNAEFRAELKRLQDHFGLSEEFFQEIERAERQAKLGDGEDRWLQKDIFEMPPTASLDELTEPAVERLSRMIDHEWLRREAEKRYRLGNEFLKMPLHIVGGGRFVTAPDDRPRRLARMLLTARDYLQRRDDLDFFEAAWAVPELVVLASNLDAVAALGPEAETKLARLPLMDEVQAASTVYELIVGGALVKDGRDARMLPEDKTRKTPDFELRGMGVPLAVECKRKIGLTEYETKEAQLVDQLFAPVLEMLRTSRRHVSVEAVFTVEVSGVPVAEFLADVRSILERDDRNNYRATRWGSIGIRPLLYFQSVRHTRLYAPDYLQQVFGWSRENSEWDGLICEVESPNRIIVNKAREPRCLKWVSLSETAMIKKARGITSVWGKAAKQLRPAEMGIIYIAYDEGNRYAVADARTKHIKDTCHEWYSRWSVTPVLTVIHRLYHRALGAGLPDLIESSIPLTRDGDEDWLGMFPINVFTRRQ